MAKKSQPRGDDGEPKKKPRLVDHISDDEDEELCEDEAFNSDDERKYGSLFSKPLIREKTFRNEGLFFVVITLNRENSQHKT